MDSHQSEWKTKVAKLRSIAHVTWVGQLAQFRAPHPGHFYSLCDMKYLITRSNGIDGVVFGVAKNRLSCFVAVELPDGSAIVVTAETPTVLETLSASVFEILGNSFACGAT